MQITLPAALHDVARMDYRIWESKLREIRRIFDRVLDSEEILEVLTAVAYVYLWFARQMAAPNIESARATYIEGLWEELNEHAAMAVAMGMYLGTPGEDLLVNIQSWGKARIPVSFRQYCEIPAHCLPRVAYQEAFPKPFEADDAESDLSSEENEDNGRVQGGTARA